MANVRMLGMYTVHRKVQDPAAPRIRRMVNAAATFPGTIPIMPKGWVAHKIFKTRGISSGGIVTRCRNPPMLYSSVVMIAIARRFNYTVPRSVFDLTALEEKHIIYPAGKHEPVVDTYGFPQASRPKSQYKDNTRDRGQHPGKSRNSSSARIIR